MCCWALRRAAAGESQENALLMDVVRWACHPEPGKRTLARPIPQLHAIAPLLFRNRSLGTTALECAATECGVKDRVNQIREIQGILKRAVSLLKNAICIGRDVRPVRVFNRSDHIKILACPRTPCIFPINRFDAKQTRTQAPRLGDLSGAHFALPSNGTGFSL
jgi:hypothetical protein